MCLLFLCAEKGKIMTNIQLQTLAQLKENLHISYSQISCYINCPLKFYFRYVKGIPNENISSALPFGKAIHSGIEHFYITYKRKQENVNIKTVEELFADVFTTEINKGDALVIFKKDETKETSIDMGKKCSESFVRM